MKIARMISGLLLVAGTAVLSTTAAEAAPTVSRIAGADRYATAAAISSVYFAPGVGVAYIATGESFPDALAGAAAAAKGGGPVLLTTRDSLPSSTATELDRLNPGTIKVLGGTSAVSGAVATQLAQYTSGAVTRIEGADRYATSAAIASQAFPNAVSTAYVTTGAAFPDALSGGAAAGAAGGPLLLVRAGDIPADTATQLDRLNPTTIVLLGGASAVSLAVENQLKSYSSNVVRRAGADRYGTSVATSSAFVSATKVFLATGESFPDALAGGSPAGLAPGPVLLVRGACIPPEVNSEIDRLNPTSLLILGGEAAVSAAVANRQVCQPPPPPPVTFGAGTFVVGSQVPAGTYRTRTDVAGCYWERLSGFGGTLDEIIANNFTNHHQVVTIAPTDAGFKSSSCGTWTNDLSPLTASPTAVFGEGTWILGTDIAAGTWNAPGGDGCYWERLSGFSGELNDIITNDFGHTNVVVAIAPSDVGFQSEGCGAWTRS